MLLSGFFSSLRFDPRENSKIDAKSGKLDFQCGVISFYGLTDLLATYHYENFIFLLTSSRANCPGYSQKQRRFWTDGYLTGRSPPGCALHLSNGLTSHSRSFWQQAYDTHLRGVRLHGSCRCHTCAPHQTGSGWGVSYQHCLPVDRPRLWRAASQLSPPAESVLYDVDRFLALLLNKG